MLQGNAKWEKAGAEQVSENNFSMGLDECQSWQQRERMRLISAGQRVAVILRF